MVLYRRNRVPGGTYFFTVTLRDRSSGLLVQAIDHLRHAFRTTHRERPFRLEAIVILPDHLHALWTLPAGDADYADGLVGWEMVLDCASPAPLYPGYAAEGNG